MEKNVLAHIVSTYFQTKNWIILMVLFSLYAIALNIEFTYLFTDTFYYSSISNTLSPTEATEFINSERRSEWVNYPISFFVTLVSSFLVALCIYIGFLTNSQHFSFHKVFSIAMKSQIIFALSYLCIVVLKAPGIIKYSSETINNVYYYQSILAIIDVQKIPIEFHYTLQCINLSEMLYVFLLSFGVVSLSKASLVSALKFVLIWYGIGLMLWITLTAFIQFVLMK